MPLVDEIDFRRANRTLNLSWRFRPRLKPFDTSQVVPLRSFFFLTHLAWFQAFPAPLTFNITLKMYPHAVASKKRRAQQKVLKMILPEGRSVGRYIDRRHCPQI